MSRLSYFQRYSQAENHATNNTLLIFRHFYRYSPLKLQQVLTALLDTEPSIGLSFELQVQGQQSVPDACIRQEPMNLYIETKRGEKLNVEQIQRHLESIKSKTSSQNNFLLGITKEPLSPNETEYLYRVAKHEGVTFATVTFSQIVQALSTQCAEYEVELKEILEDYSSYLGEEGLLEERFNRMIVVPCGDSYPDNKQYKLYYEPIGRPCKSNRYIGIYTNKQIIYVGKIEAIIICDYLRGESIFHTEKGTCREAHRYRIKEAIEAIAYHNLKETQHRFYLVDEFVETRVHKTSSGGVLGPRYVDLEKIALPEYSSGKDYTSAELATLLQGKSFA